MSISYPSDYRADQTTAIFGALEAGSSCSIVGVSGTAKSNLYRFLLLPETRSAYLPETWQQYFFLTIDSHRLTELSAHAFFDALEDAILDVASAEPSLQAPLKKVEGLPAIGLSGAETGASLKQFFRSAELLLADPARHLVVLLDQFDNLYQALPPRVFANLVALRDQFKYRVSYVTLTSEELPLLCNVSECQDFYDLFKDNVIGLGPYNEADCWFELRKLAALNKVQLQESVGAQLIRLSGGHPGLLKALYLSYLKTGNPPQDDWAGLQDLLLRKGIEGECQSLLNRLRAEEQRALEAIAQGGGLPDDPVLVEGLRLKGLVSPEEQVFSPLVARAILKTRPSQAARTEMQAGPIRIDRSDQVFVYGKVRRLLPMERALLRFLMDHPGETCTRDDIDKHLRQNSNRQEPMSNEAIDKQISRLREKIEIDSKHPKLIWTVPKGGYRLDV